MNFKLSETIRDEGNCTGSSGRNCGCSLKDQYVIIVMSEGLLIVLCKDRQTDPRGWQELMFILLLRRSCSWYEYFCICSYTDEAWQGQWFKLSSRALKRDRLALTGHGGSLHRVWRVGTSVCALFSGKGHKGITFQTSQLLDFFL